MTRLPTWPALLPRLVVFGAGLAALLLAYPGRLDNLPPVAALSAAALWPAARPRGWAPETTMALIVACWLVRTWGTGGTPSFWPALALSGLLYLLHTFAALSSLLPVDTVTQAGAVRGHLLRALLTLGLSAALVLVVVALLTLVSGEIAFTSAYVGVGAVLAVLLLLTTLTRMRTSGDPPESSDGPGQDRERDHRSDSHKRR